MGSEKLEGLVPVDVIRKIEQMSLNRAYCNDEFVWLEARDGKYAVKKGYHCVRNKRRRVNKRAGSSDLISKEVWSQMWKIKVLPKITHFIWRCLVQAVPVKEKLFKRRCSPSNICPICETEPETVEHAIFLCPWTRYVWFGCNLALRFDDKDMPKFDVWRSRMLTEKKIFYDNQIAYFVWLIWLIWKERNRVVFEFKTPDPVRMVSAVGRALDEFWKARG